MSGGNSAKNAIFRNNRREEGKKLFLPHIVDYYYDQQLQIFGNAKSRQKNSFLVDCENPNSYISFAKIAQTAAAWWFPPFVPWNEGSTVRIFIFL